MWTREDLAYIAGVFEGEGNIAIGKLGGVKLVIEMTDRDVVERVASLARVGTVWGPYSRPDRPRSKPTYRWHVQSRTDAYALLVAIYPWLGARRRQRAAEVVHGWLTYGNVRVAA